jgi:hypothetical protein
MAYTLQVEIHPLGIVVQNDAGERELLIEGESCCGINYDTLRQIALTQRHVVIDEADAAACRLK